MEPCGATQPNKIQDTKVFLRAYLGWSLEICCLKLSNVQYLFITMLCAKMSCVTWA